MSEAAIVLKEKGWMRSESGVRRSPIDSIRGIDVEVGHHRRALPGHIRRRRKILLLDILQVADQSFLRSATSTRIPLDRSLIDHDCEGESRMLFGLCHHHFSGIVDESIRTVPIDDDSIDAPTDHVVNLPRDLRGVGGAVSHAHVIRLSEPKQQMGIDLGGSPGIKQRVNVDLAHVARAKIAVSLAPEVVGRARVVGGLGRESGGWDDIVARPTHHWQGQ